MPQQRTSSTRTLPNGNRVTITLGGGRRGTYKTVTVRRPNGTSDSRTYRRGVGSSYFLGGYDTSVPNWASNSSGMGSGSGSGSGWKVILVIIGVALYLMWPLAIGAKTVGGNEHVSTVGVVVLVIWLPIAIGAPLLIWRAYAREKRAALGTDTTQHIEQALNTGTPSTPSTMPPRPSPTRKSPPSPSASTPPTTGTPSNQIAKVAPTKPRQRSSGVVFPIDDKAGWRALYMASEIRRGIAEYEDDYNDFAIGFVRSTGEVFSNPADALSALSKEPIMAIQNLTRLINGINGAVDSGDVTLIRRIAANFVEVYALLIAWAHRMRGASVVEPFRPVFDASAKYVAMPLRQIREFADQYAEVVRENTDDLRAGRTPHRPAPTLTLSIDPQAIAEFDAAIAAAKAARPPG